jgi:hypothetical protein
MSTDEPVPDEVHISEEALHPMPALYHHCVTVYAKMLETAEPVPKTEYALYTGKLTKLFGELYLSLPYYTKVTQALKDMDCIRQQKRGGGSAPSEWLMVQVPSRELWTLVRDDGKMSSAAQKNQVHDQQMRDLSSRIDRIEEALGL